MREPSRNRTMSRVRGVNLGVAHNTVGKIGVAGVPGVNLAEAAPQPLIRVGNRPPSALIGQRITFKCQPRAGKAQFAFRGEMGIDGVPLHARPLGNGSDARVRRPQLGV